MGYIGRFHWKTQSNDFSVPYIVSDTLYDKLSSAGLTLLDVSDIEVTEITTYIDNFYRESLGFVPYFYIPTKQSVNTDGPNAWYLAYFDLIRGFPSGGTINSIGTAEELNGVSGFMLPPIRTQGTVFNGAQQTACYVSNISEIDRPYSYFPNFSINFYPFHASTLDPAGVTYSYNIPVVPERAIENGVFISSFRRHELFVQLRLYGLTTSSIRVDNLRIDISNYPAGENTTKFTNLLVGQPVDTYTFDPFTPNITGPGGPSGSTQGGDGTGGGFGDFDYHSDDVGPSDAPTISAADSGMLTIHVGTVANMRALGNYLWSSSFSIDNFKKLLANPMDCIIGCHMIPYFDGLTVTDSTIKVGNLNTGVSFPAASHQFYKFSCGSINITSQSLSHSFMDFLPHLHCYLYLPFIGIVPVSTDEVIDHVVTVSYICDVATGSVIAQISMDSNLVYNYTGNFAASVPISNGEYNNVLQSALQSTQILTAGFLNATGGVQGAMGSGSQGSQAVIGMARAGAQAMYATNDTTNQVIQNVLSTVKPAISRSGAFSGTSGFMANRSPFLIITAPNLAVPKSQNHYTGYPQYETVSLGSCSGYTQVAAVHLEGFAATEEEKSEILQMLSDGVMF